MGPALLAAVLIGALAIAIGQSQRDAHRATESRFAERARATAASIDGFLASISRQTANELPNVYGASTLEPADLEERTRRTSALYSLVAEADGRVVAATPGSPSPARKRIDRAARLLRSFSRSYVVSGVLHESGRPAIEFSIPYRAGGRTRVLTSAVPVGAWSAFLDATLARMPRGPGGRALIVDPRGRLLGDSRGAVGAGTTSAADVLADTGFVDPVTVRERVGDSPFSIVVAAPRADLHRFAGRRDWLPWAILLLAAAALASGLWLLARLARTNAELRRTEARFALAARGANDGIWDWDLIRDRIHYSDRWAEMLGATPSELGENPDAWFERVHPEDRMALDAAIGEHLSGTTDLLSHEHRLRGEDGWLWVLVRGVAVCDEAGRPARMAGSLSDVSEQRRAVERLEHQANHDPLTGLVNRGRFHALLDRAVQRVGRGGTDRCALVFLDLDGFKAVNDRHGHLTGDQLLRELAERIQDSIRPGDVAGRLGGDEFGVLLAHVEDEAEAEAIAMRLCAFVSKPFAVDSTIIAVTASAGVAVARRHDTAEDLLRWADAAMYRDKATA